MEALGKAHSEVEENLAEPARSMSDIEELIALTYQPITSEGKAKIFKFIQKHCCPINFQ